MIQPEEETVSRLIIVVQNWFLITAHADLVEQAVSRSGRISRISEKC